MFNFNDYFENDESSQSSPSPKKQKKTKKPTTNKQTTPESSFGMDFNLELIKQEAIEDKKEQMTFEQKMKYEETQRHIQEENIKKIYKKVGRKKGRQKDPKIKNVKRLNKQNLKQKYNDRFLGKVNTYKTRYFANGFSKKLYLEKYKKEQDKLDMEAGFGIDLEELNRQDKIGRAF